MKTPMFLLLAGVVLFACGCASSTPPPKFSEPIRPIEGVLGKELTLTLPSDPTKDYKWELAEPLDENKIRFVKSEYLKSDPKQVGKGNMEVWTFRPVGVGQTLISMRYVSPSETGVVPAGKSLFTVNILPW